MSFLLVAPEILDSAAADVSQIGSALGADNLAAALPTTQLTAAAADEVSTAIAAVFAAYAKEYQTAATLAATYHEQFVRELNAAATTYASTEASINTTLQEVVTAVNAVASNGFQTLVYGPIHAVGEAWINSPIGQALDPIINAPTEASVGARSDRQRRSRHRDGPQRRRRWSAVRRRRRRLFPDRRYECDRR